MKLDGVGKHEKRQFEVLLLCLPLHSENKPQVLMTVKENIQDCVRNAYGIRVKRCCASCQHKSVRDLGVRICLLTQLIVKQTDVCPLWQMSDGLMNAGRGGGKVHSKDYLIEMFNNQIARQYEPTRIS